MLELVQLEKRHADFAGRNADVIVVSMEGTTDAQLTQERFPHLVVLSDSGRGLSDAVGLVHVHAAPDGSDADMPTTILLDRNGVVRWIYRKMRNGQPWHIRGVDIFTVRDGKVAAKLAYVKG